MPEINKTKAKDKKYGLQIIENWIQIKWADHQLIRTLGHTNPKLNFQVSSVKHNCRKHHILSSMVIFKPFIEILKSKGIEVGKCESDF